MALTISEHNSFLTNHHNSEDKIFLQDYIKQAHVRYEVHKLQHPEYGVRFEDEDLIWAIQDWFGMMGQFSEEELHYLKETYGLNQVDIEAICLDED